jgi:hypothetical protein
MRNGIIKSEAAHTADFLAQVRDVLEGLYNSNNDCWCSDSEQEPHSAACLAAQALMEQLKGAQ